MCLTGRKGVNVVKLVKDCVEQMVLGNYERIMEVVRRSDRIVDQKKEQQMDEIV